MDNHVTGVNQDPFPDIGAFDTQQFDAGVAQLGRNMVGDGADMRLELPLQMIMQSVMLDLPRTSRVMMSRPFRSSILSAMKS